MFDLPPDDDRLGGQLMAIARDTTLRQAVYARIGEYCHQCRNRLNSLKLSLYLARREATGRASETWEALEKHYLALEQMIERVQVICRPMTLSRVRLGLDLLIDDRRARWSDLLAERGGELVCIPPGERAVATLDVDRMGLALDALATWRARVAPPGTNIRLRWRVDSGRARIGWEEEVPRAKFALDEGWGRGWEGDWTLPLLARVLAAHDGDLRIDEMSGWRLELSWPDGSS